jgi:hypothetical protein
MSTRFFHDHAMGIVDPTHPETLNMEHPQTPLNGSVDFTRPSTHRQRSNSFPMVEALGCSTPEAQLLLAEGRAAVRKRRARGRRNWSLNDEDTTTFEPRDHLKYLEGGQSRASTEPLLANARISHARTESNTTDRSTSTVVPATVDGEPRNNAPASPLGNYSANLAQFIKAQLKSIPTYHPESDAISPLSPQSCPDFSFPVRTPSLSPKPSLRRPMEAPKAIEIPPVRPPARSAFSAWSSTDDDTDDDAASLPNIEQYIKTVGSRDSNYTPSVLGYYEASNNASFLFSSTPMEDPDEPDTAKTATFPDQSGVPEPASEPHDSDDYPSSDCSRPQLTSSSAPSYSTSSPSASVSSSSYFDCKRPFAVTPQLKDRIIAALTPPHPPAKTISATSPWEGGAIANVHDVFVDSQQRVHVDGMSFDMMRDLNHPIQTGTPC